MVGVVLNNARNSLPYYYDYSHYHYDYSSTTRDDEKSRTSSKITELGKAATDKKKRKDSSSKR